VTLCNRPQSRCSRRSNPVTITDRSPLARRQHRHGAPSGAPEPGVCHVYLAEGCHLYIALTKKDAEQRLWKIRHCRVKSDRLFN
jgi:hypothetical protein